MNGQNFELKWQRWELNFLVVSIADILSVRFIKNTHKMTTQANIFKN